MGSITIPQDIFTRRQLGAPCCPHKPEYELLNSLKRKASHFARRKHSIMVDAWRKGMESLHRALVAARQHTPTARGRMILIARIDVKFLGTPIRDVWSSAAWNAPSTVFLPRFHHWGAANDRFSYGSARLMRKLVKFRLNVAYDGNVATSEQAMCDAIHYHNASVVLTPVQFVRVRANLEVPTVDAVVVASGDDSKARYEGGKWYRKHSNVMCDSCFHSPQAGDCLREDEVGAAGLRPWR